MIGKRMSAGSMVCLSVVFVICALSGCTRPAPVYERPVQDARYQKELEEIKKNMRGDVKIRLKRDGKGAYSWEVSGKDPHEILKNNAIISKKISSEQRE